MKHRITLDGALLAEVTAVLVSDYILEQCKLHGWRIVSVGHGSADGRSIEIMDGAALRVLEVTG